MYKYHQNGRYPLGPVAISSTVSEISNPVATFKIILSEYIKCIYITWRTCLIQMKSQTILLCMIRIKYYHLYILEVFFFNLALLLTKRGFNMFWKMWLVLSLTNIFLVVICLIKKRSTTGNGTHFASQNIQHIHVRFVGSFSRLFEETKR